MDYSLESSYSQRPPLSQTKRDVAMVCSMVAALADKLLVTVVRNTKSVSSRDGNQELQPKHMSCLGNFHPTHRFHLRSDIVRKSYAFGCSLSVLTKELMRMRKRWEMNREKRLTSLPRQLPMCFHWEYQIDSSTTTRMMEMRELSYHNLVLLVKEMNDAEADSFAAAAT